MTKTNIKSPAKISTDTVFCAFDTAFDIVFNKIEEFMDNKDQDVSETPLSYNVLNSKTIKKIEYDNKTVSLTVTFQTDQKYLYNNVPESIYQDFIKSESKGKFFARYIKHSYDGIKI